MTFPCNLSWDNFIFKPGPVTNNSFPKEQAIHSLLKATRFSLGKIKPSKTIFFWITLDNYFSPRKTRRITFLTSYHSSRKICCVCFLGCCSEFLASCASMISVLSISLVKKKRDHQMQILVSQHISHILGFPWVIVNCPKKSQPKICV